jgi:hypothetical protein
MRSLRELELEECPISGTLPTWAPAKGWDNLDLEASLISGTVPPDLLARVTGELDASECLLSGTLPDVALEGGIRSLQLDDNFKLSGTIPPSLVNVHAVLRYLDVDETSISGTIPQELWQLSTLRIIDVDDTPVSGTISPGVGQLTQVSRLHFDNTKMSGTLPAQLGNLRLALLELDVAGSSFSGTLPLAALQQLNKLRECALQADGALVDGMRLPITNLFDCDESTRGQLPPLCAGSLRACGGLPPPRPPAPPSPPPPPKPPPPPLPIAPSQPPSPAGGVRTIRTDATSSTVAGLSVALVVLIVLLAFAVYAAVRARRASTPWGATVKRTLSSTTTLKHHMPSDSRELTVSETEIPTRVAEDGANHNTVV